MSSPSPNSYKKNSTSKHTTYNLRTLTSTFSFDGSSMVLPLPPPGVYHIRIQFGPKPRYLIENGNFIFTDVEVSGERGLFRLSHNTDDGTVSLYSIAACDYIRFDSGDRDFKFEYGKIAKFELRRPNNAPVKEAVMLRFETKFVRRTFTGLQLYDNEDDASLLEFVPVNERNGNAYV